MTFKHLIAALLLAACDGDTMATDLPDAGLPGEDHATLASCRAGSIVDITTASGTIDAAAYQQIAAGLATADGIAYRYGPTYADCHERLGDFATVWQPTDKISPPDGNYPGGVYQVGEWDSSVGDFSSSQGQVAYVPTTPGAGIATLEMLAMGHQTFSYRPQLSWTMYTAGNPDPNVTREDWVAMNGAPITGAVAVARTYARGEASANSIAVFQSGLVGTFGPNTARAAVSLQLPAGKVPTAIAITGNNEFALVTVWDTAAQRGQLAVIALGGQHPNIAIGDTWEFWGFDWSELYPGFMNYAYYTYMKLLGFIDLPDLAAPTEISASLDYRSNEWLQLPGGGNAQPSQLTLSDETNRQSFIDGINSGKRPRAGFAVIVSRSERKATFVDLQPLFEAFNQTYFGARADFDAALANTGMAPDQWPRTFDRAPASMPRVVTTIALDGAPTAVRTGVPRNGGAPPRAYIATMDGTITTYAVGGLADTADADADAITAMGTVDVGLNPTSLVPGKDHWYTVDAARTMVSVARADRRVDFLAVDDTGLLSITKTLRDSRLVDPIAAEDVNNHGTESYVVTVADYAGAAVRSYRYGPVIMHTNGATMYGMGPTGEDAFEYGGAFLPRGAPFQISTTNVP